MTQRTRSYPYKIQTRSSNIFIRLLRRFWNWC